MSSVETNNKRQEESAADGEAPSNKRQKKSVAEDLVCPITLELPWDPVTAEDGRVYERTAIEAHFKSSQGGGETKSPMTNEKMGKRLFPAPQTKNVVESLVESGQITGALAEAWNKKAKEKKDMEELLKKAESGDQKAMINVADSYFWGNDGFDKDPKLACLWCKKLHDAGSVWGTVRLGFCLCTGAGVTSSPSQGLVHISVAAGQGSNAAAYLLGLAYASGNYGLTVNKTEAIRWLQKSLRADCPYDNLSDVRKEKAQKKLNELLS